MINLTNDKDPVFWHYDAGDYGTGAYMFHVVDGKEFPAAFLSKR
jgi:hypothetical protein